MDEQTGVRQKRKQLDHVDVQMDEFVGSLQSFQKTEDEDGLGKLQASVEPIPKKIGCVRKKERKGREWNNKILRINRSRFEVFKATPTWQKL